MTKSLLSSLSLFLFLSGGLAVHAEAQEDSVAPAEVEASEASTATSAQAAPASASETAPEPANAAATQEQAATPGEPATAQTSSQDTAARANPLNPPAAPPIMVVVLASDSVPPEVSAEAQGALVELVRPLAQGRGVHGLSAGELFNAFAACESETCRGALLANAPAMAGLILELRRSGRRSSIQAELSFVDAVTGAARNDSRRTRVFLNRLESWSGALTPLVEGLGQAMPAAPRRPATLVLGANVDGARIQIDGYEAGSTPVAPIRLVSGDHQLAVTSPGYLSVRRALRIQAGERQRLNITLVPVEGGYEEPEDPSATNEWYEEWYTWAGVGAAVLVGIAIGVGVAVSNANTPPPNPSGIPLPPLEQIP